MGKPATGHDFRKIQYDGKQRRFYKAYAAFVTIEWFSRLRMFGFYSVPNGQTLSTCLQLHGRETPTVSESAKFWYYIE